MWLIGAFIIIGVFIAIIRYDPTFDFIVDKNHKIDKIILWYDNYKETINNNPKRNYIVIYSKE